MSNMQTKHLLALLLAAPAVALIGCADDSANAGYDDDILEDEVVGEVEPAENTRDARPAAPDSYTEDTDRTERPTSSVDEAMNRAALSQAPVPVRQAFLEEHAGAQVTGVRSMTGGGNTLVYEVTYIENGDAKIAAYNAQGEPTRTANTAGSTGGPATRGGLPAPGVGGAPIDQ